MTLREFFQPSTTMYSTVSQKVTSSDDIVDYIDKKITHHGLTYTELYDFLVRFRAVNRYKEISGKLEKKGYHIRA